jgi:hypothetical protein
MTNEFKDQLKSGYFQLKDLIKNPNSTEDQLFFAEKTLDRFFQTFEGWKKKGACVGKGEISFIFDPEINKAIFCSLQLKKNYGLPEYCRLDEELGTNHFGI